MSKVIPPPTKSSLSHKDNITNINNVNGHKVNDICEDIPHVDNVNDHVIGMPTNTKGRKTELKNKPNFKAIHKNTDNEKRRHDKTRNSKKDQSFQMVKNIDCEKKVKTNRKPSKKVEANEKFKDKVMSSEKPKYISKKYNGPRKIQNNIPEDILMSRFENATSSNKQRCNILHKKDEDLFNNRKKWKREVFVNETVQYSNIIKNNKNVSLRKEIEEIVIHDYVPLTSKYSPCSFDNRVWNNMQKKPYKSSYDLVRTILKTPQTIGKNFTQEAMPIPIEINALSSSSYLPCRSETEPCTIAPLTSRLTYDSHNHTSTHVNIVKPVEDFNINKHFITKQSKDNFVVPISEPSTRKRYKGNAQKTTEFKRKKPYDKIRSIFDAQYTNDFQQQSVRIDFSTEITDNLLKNCCLSFKKRNKESPLNDREYSDNYLTYTLKKHNYDVPVPHEDKHFDETYSLHGFRPAPNNYIHQKYEDFQDYVTDYRSEQRYERLDNSDTIQQTNKPMSNGGVQDTDTKVNVNVIFVSESQERLIQGTSEANVEPLEICEVVHSEHFEITESSIRQQNNSSLDEFYVNSFLLDRHAYSTEPRNSSKDNIDEIKNYSNHIYNQRNLDKITTAAGTARSISIQNTVNLLQIDHIEKMVEDNFNITDRPRFVPKGKLILN